ncbi:MAG: DUF1553 domain-containing protein, partial [Planctomycetes bacterium]|nr:DUF1553 domain-containing protein [Planctomycetota bacterium]
MIDVPVPEFESSVIHSIRLEALADESLPGKGPGFANGNFVVSKISAMILPPAGTRLEGRFVRVEQIAKKAFLHLAEVQAFNGTENVALTGEAKQVSTDFEGPASFAIDGRTSGEFARRTVSHTGEADNPWWEVDLKKQQPIDRIVVWNRTDQGTESRLNNYRITLLDQDRNLVWEYKSTEPPNPSKELSLNGVREVPLATAIADYEQSSFEAANVIAGKANSGWAVGGQTGQSHSLTLIPKSPIEAKPGSKFSITIDQSSNLESHVLGKFRLSFTDHAKAEEFARTPATILSILKTNIESRTDEQKRQLATYYVSIAPELKESRDKLASFKKQLSDLKPAMTVPIMKELPTDQRRKTLIQHRGNFLDTGAEVTEGLPSAFPFISSDVQLNRMTLAKWLVDPNNPLTARVIVNRF